jgi:hypothetical protein
MVLSLFIQSFLNRQRVFPFDMAASETDDSEAFREGKIRLRFIRKNKKPAGAMSNYKDGEIYWMFPRHAALPWWEMVDKIDYPFVPKAALKDSALAFGDLDDMEQPAYLGDSGIKIGPGGIKGGFVEPIASPTVEEVETQDFQDSTPSETWKKKELLDFITSKGGVAFMTMTRAQLLAVALNLV